MTDVSTTCAEAIFRVKLTLKMVCHLEKLTPLDYHPDDLFQSRYYYHYYAKPTARLNSYRYFIIGLYIEIFFFLVYIQLFTFALLKTTGPP